MSSAEGFCPAVMVRLMRELRSLTEAPVDGVCLVLGEDGSVADIAADVDGPSGTPFELGRFRLRLSLPADFPSSPPKAFFLTKIFHPNVSASGEVCVNTLKRDWRPSLGLRHVLQVVRCLLIQPNPESALNEEAGRLLMEAYPEYERRARLMTRVHAAPLPHAAAARPRHDSEGKKEAAAAGPEGGGRSSRLDEEPGGQENTHCNSPSHSLSQQPLTHQQQAAAGRRRRAVGVEADGQRAGGCRASRGRSAEARASSGQGRRQGRQGEGGHQEEPQAAVRDCCCA